MNHIARAPVGARPVTQRVLVSLALVVVAITAVLAHPSASSSASSLFDALRGDDHGTFGVAGGVVPDGTTVLDGDVPAVANLDPSLLDALRRAAAEAAADGVELEVNSAWRSTEYQEQLLR